MTRLSPADRKWLLSVVRRGEMHETGHEDGMAFAHDGRRIHMAPGSIAKSELYIAPRRKTMQQNLRRRVFRAGRLRAVSYPVAVEAKRAPGLRYQAPAAVLDLVFIPNDKGTLTATQRHYLRAALRGLNLASLRVAAWDFNTPVRLTDGTRWAWVMPVRVSAVPPNAESAVVLS